MHELPKDLTSSLRSYRGSIYGGRNSTQYEPVDQADLEKGVGGGEDDNNPTKSSLILHPTKSSSHLREHSRRRPQISTDHDFEKTDWADPTSASQPRDRPATSESKAVAIKNTVPSTPATTKQSVFQGARVADPDPASSRFDDDLRPLSSTHFYELMGMRPPTNPLTPPRHLATRGGLYGTILDEMRSVQYKYRIFDILTYLLLGLQLVLSALFIILGSLSPRINTHVVIAVLGAVSTVIAGSLALMKGQGLPNRLRQTRDAMRNVAFAAEELYQDFMADRPILFKDVKRIREDYLRVMEEARKNHPDSWNRAGDDRGAAGGASSGRALEAGLSKGGRA